QYSSKAVYQKMIAQVIEREKISHIIVETYNRESGGNRGLDRYFSTCKVFERIPTSFDGISLYRVKDNIPEAYVFPTILDIESISLLNQISLEKSKKSKMFLMNIFETIFPADKCKNFAEKSAKDLKTSKMSNSEARALNEKAMKLMRYGQFEDATETFKKTICKNPGFLDAYGNLAVAYGAFERETALTMRPGNPVAYYHNGIFWGEFGRFDVAIANLEKAVQLDPGNPEIYAMLGFLKVARKDYSNAIYAFQKAASIYKEFSGPRLNGIVTKLYVSIGQAHEKLGNPAEAKAFYEQAIYFSDESNARYKLPAYLRLGLFYQNQKDYGSAIKSFKRMAGLDPDSAEAHYYLCKNYLSLGNRKQAISHYKKLKKLNAKLSREIGMALGRVLD
ncbi:tetratricopeptide repeat protein, partial [Thermodesulfobacteriota bacterium]